MINPDAGDLGAKVGFVFFGLGLPLCVLFFFFIPETRGLTFEEVSKQWSLDVFAVDDSDEMHQMDHLFTNKASCRYFQQDIAKHRARTGTRTAGSLSTSGVDNSEKGIALSSAL